MNKDELMKRRELLLRRKELLSKKAELEAQAAPEQEPVHAPHSIAKTAKEHGVEGLALGHGDTIAGGINKALDKGMRITNKLGLTGPSPYEVDERLVADGATGDLSQKGAYREGVDDRRQLLQETYEDNPKTAMAADFAGGLVTSGLAAAGTGGMSLAGEGAVVGTGYGDSDTLGGMAQDAAVGAALGKYGGKALNAAGRGLKSVGRKLTPDVAKSIYTAIARKTGGKQPEKVIDAIKNIEEKTGLFTAGDDNTISAESVEGGLQNFYNTAQESLAGLTQSISKNVNPQQLKEKFSPVVGKLDEMFNDVISNTTNKELANKLTQSKDLLQNAINAGDYKRVVDIMNQEIKERYVSYNSLGEAQVSKPIRAKMKQMLSEFDGLNKDLIETVGGKEAGEKFSENMADLKDYYKVSDVVKKNIGKEAGGAKARIQDFVVGGAIGTMFSNPLLTAAYIKGASELRNPAVQGFLAKSYKAIPRAFEPVKDFITNSPISGVLMENLPEEVGQLLKKVQAGVNIPTVQQHLVVKSMTSMFPEFFEYSEYQSLVDGKITDPYEVGLEKKKISQDDSISNIDKFRRTNALNKDGTMLRNASTARGTVQPVDQGTKEQLANFLNIAEGVKNGTN